MLSHKHTLRDDEATVCRIMVWLIGVSHAECWKAFLLAVALADLNTRAREVTQQEGGKADNEKEKETSARPSAHPSVLDLGQTISPTTRSLPLGGRNTTTF